MATLGEFVSTLAKNAGVDLNSDDLKGWLSSPELSNAPFPDSIAQGINNGLLTVDSAKNHSDIKKHFFGVYATDQDLQLKKTLKQLNIPEELHSEILKAEGVYNRHSVLATKIAELEAKKAGATGGDKTELNNQIAKLNKQITDLNQEYEAKIANTAKEKDEHWGNLLRNNELKTFFGQNFEYAGEFPKELMLDTAMIAFNRELSKNGFVLNYSPDKPGQFSLVKPDGTVPYDQNKPIELKDLATRVLAENKLLKVSGTPNTGAPNQIPNFVPQVQNGGAPGPDTSAYQAALQQAAVDNSRVN